MIDFFKKIIYGETELSEAAIFQNGSPHILRPIILAIYLIKANDRLILVDAGCDTMPGFRLKNFIGPVSALKNAGYTAEQITDVIITHSHHDHIDGVKHFGNATVYIQRDEFMCGQEYLPLKATVKQFEESCVVAEHVTVRKIAGHSVGSSIVEFEFNNQKYVICGDECYSHDNLRLNIPTGASVDLEKSIEFIRNYGNAGFNCLLCHE